MVDLYFQNIFKVISYLPVIKFTHVKCDLMTFANLPSCQPSQLTFKHVITLAGCPIPIYINSSFHPYPQAAAAPHSRFSHRHFINEPGNM